MISVSNSKTIGGEQELFTPLNYGVTNSGRASLRWAIASLGLTGKTVLVPDFHCEIITDVLREQGVNIATYQVNRDFSFSLSSDMLDKSDAVYLIRYFGMNTNAFCSAIHNSQKTLIIDDVFGVEPPDIKSTHPWCYFNSLRKISPVADYSQLISNCPLSEITPAHMKGFADTKYKAKSLKADYLSHGNGLEQEYLRLFNQGEALLKSTNDIFLPSAKSSVLANIFYSRLNEERQIRLNNLATAKEMLPPEMYVDVSIDFPSFLPVYLANREVVRLGLTASQIYLAIHWPEVRGVPNQISDSILSIPLDSRYSPKDISFVCQKILELNDDI